ncbi:MAG: polysaccharide pyruvyl transferase family protein [Oscillospiraceae bacterium]
MASETHTDQSKAGTDREKDYGKRQVMKICTITCHDVYNVGASLQAYALQTYLKSLGHDVKIIDYKPDYLSKHYRLDIVSNPKYDKPFLKQAYLLAKLPGRLHMLPRKKAFDSFTAKYLDLTKRYTSNAELKKEPPEADAFLAGSDQIWNPLFPNGKDPAFYLDFALHGIRASYAASFAVDEFPQELREVTAQYLKRFDHIAVREKSGLSVLKTLGITNAVTVLDPVFLLDRAQWEAMAERPEGCEAPYLLVYDFDNSPAVRKLAGRIAAERGLHIYSVFKIPYAERCFSLCGPENFLGLVQGADFVLSNSFHATAFSVIFEREFAVVERTEKINTRMRDFTTMLGLSDHMVTTGTEIPAGTDWTAVRRCLKDEIDHAKAYIDEVLRDVER